MVIFTPMFQEDQKMRINANIKDVRIQRSRRDLMNALESLLPQKSFDDITIKDITDRALVSKNTFYNNFTDKDSLLEALFARYAEELRGKLEALKKTIPDSTPIDEIYRFFAKAIVDYLYDTLLEGGNIFLHDTSKTLFWAFESFCRKATVQIAGIYAKIVDIHSDYDLLSAFFGGGFANLIYYLMTSRKTIDRQKAIDTFYEITLPHSMRRRNIKA